MKDNELKKLTNKDLILSALKCIEDETHFHIIYKNFMNTYFFFDRCDDSVCHFRIKELPGYLFAFWVPNFSDNEIDNYKYCQSLQIPRETELIFFTQFERDLDKFKPSRSGFVTGIFRRSWYEQANDSDEEVHKEEWYLNGLDAILIFMKKHKFKAYDCITSQISEVYYERSLWHCIKEYYINAYYSYKYENKRKQTYNHTLKAVNKVLNKITTYDYLLRDYGDCCYPRLHLFLREKQNLSKYIENQTKIAEDDSLLVKLENKYYSSLTIDYFQDCDEMNDKKLCDRFYNLANIEADDIKLIRKSF